MKTFLQVLAGFIVLVMWPAFFFAMIFIIVLSFIAWWWMASPADRFRFKNDINRKIRKR